MKKQKTIFCFSGGKDNALALHELVKTNDYEIVTLLTTVTGDYDRTSMHGVRMLLLDQQAESIGLPLQKVFISTGCTNEEYESKMRDTLQKYVNLGVTSVAFGDIFLEDLMGCVPGKRTGEIASDPQESQVPADKGFAETPEEKCAHSALTFGISVFPTSTCPSSIHSS